MPAARAACAMRVEIGFERVEVDDERGRVDRRPGVADAGRDALHQRSPSGRAGVAT